jgi:hypothetical protein
MARRRTRMFAQPEQPTRETWWSMLVTYIAERLSPQPTPGPCVPIAVHNECPSCHLVVEGSQYVIWDQRRPHGEQRVESHGDYVQAFARLDIVAKYAAPTPVASRVAPSHTLQSTH